MRMILLVAVLAVLAVAACGKKGSEAKGDCTVSVDNAMKLSREDMKKSNVGDETIPKIRDASIARCKEDKWSNEVLKCLADAKTADDVTSCQSKMSKEQNEALAKAITALMAADAPPDPDGTDPSGGPDVAGLPAECADYNAMIEKVAACEALPADARELLQKTYDTTAQTWANLDKLPDEAKAALVDTCKTAVEALKKAAGTACGL